MPIVNVKIKDLPRAHREKAMQYKDGYVKYKLRKSMGILTEKDIEEQPFEEQTLVSAFDFMTSKEGSIFWMDINERYKKVEWVSKNGIKFHRSGLQQGYAIIKRDKKTGLNVLGGYFHPSPTANCQVCSLAGIGGYTEVFEQQKISGFEMILRDWDINFMSKQLLIDVKEQYAKNVEAICKKLDIEIVLNNKYKNTRNTDMRMILMTVYK